MSPPKCVLPLTPQSSCWLIVNAPVLLTVNVSPCLVNGLIGRVVSVNTKSVDVYFHDIHETHAISRSSYHQFVDGKTIFVCKQFALALAYSLTIHTCQGMTLTYAVCSGRLCRCLWPGPNVSCSWQGQVTRWLNSFEFQERSLSPLAWMPSVAQCVFKLCLTLHAVKQPMLMHIR